MNSSAWVPPSARCPGTRMMTPSTPVAFRKSRFDAVVSSHPMLSISCARAGAGLDMFHHSLICLVGAAYSNHVPRRVGHSHAKEVRRVCPAHRVNLGISEARSAEPGEVLAKAIRPDWVLGLSEV